MFFKRTTKKISIIIGIVLLLLWFVGNLGLYLYLKYSILSKPSIKEAINYTPEKLKLVESDIKAEYLHLMGFKLKFPFHKEDIKYVVPTFIDGKLWSISIFFKRDDSDKRFISFQDYEFLENIEKSFLSHLWEKIAYKDVPFYESFKDIEHANLKDYSWWNLLSNIRLSNLLKLKAFSTEPYEKKVYDLESPYFKGILTKFNIKPGKFIQSACYFGWGDKSYSFDAVGSDKEINTTIKDMLSTIQRLDNVEESYKEIEVLYKNEENSRFPEELLLLSLISLRGSTENNLKELHKIMEDKHYKPIIMESVKEALEYQNR